MTAPRNDATTEGEMERHNAAKPDRGQADSGKSGGRTQGGSPGASQMGRGDGAGTNAQRSGPSGSETERDAPGMSTDKKPDDTK